MKKRENKGSQSIRNLYNIYDAKKNSFTLLSIVLALMIIYYHCYFIFYGPIPPKMDIFSYIFEGENTGSIVVAAFCVISGFMITTSIQKSKNIRKYIIKRVKRIFPAYALVLILSALVMSPIISNMPIKDFYQNSSLYLKYIVDNLLLFKNSVYGIADVFLNNPYPVAINGSIWYIKHQFFCYIYIIPLFFLFMKNKKNNNQLDYKYFFVIILVLTILSYSGSFVGIYRIIKENFGFIGIFNEIESLVKIVYYFSAGVFINIYKEKIIYSKKNILFGLFVLLITFRTKMFPYFCLILLPYFIIFLGTLKINFKLPDISYYIFLVGFPIQQLLMQCIKSNIYVYITLSLAISILVGYLIYLIIDVFPSIIYNKLMKKE